MNNPVYIAQLVGTISIFFLFCIKFWIAISPKSTKRTLRIAVLWTTIYIFFLFILRLFSLIHLGTQDQLRIVSGYAALIPLVAVIIHLFLQKKLDEEVKEYGSKRPNPFIGGKI